MRVIKLDGERRRFEPLSAREVHVWYISDVHPEYWREVHDSLSVSERARAERFALPLHRATYIRSRAILRAVLAQYEPHIDHLDYVHGDFGKPAVDGGACQFNLSHSAASLALAVAPMQIGMDIERKRPLDTPGLAKLCLSKYEQTALSALPEAEELDYFFTIWTAKEALLKASGFGLRVDPRRISLEISDSMRITSLPESLGKAADWSVLGLTLNEGFAAAVAAAAPHMNICVLRCSVSADSIHVCEPSTMHSINWL